MCNLWLVSPSIHLNPRFTYLCFSPDVEFCAYTVPHPMEHSMHFRIQMKKGRAVDALKRCLEDLVAVSEHILDEFSREKQEFDGRQELST